MLKFVLCRIKVFYKYALEFISIPEVYVRRTGKNIFKDEIIVEI
jgi:hypothetical protein